MEKAFRIFPWIILFVPFIALTLFYNWLNDEVLIYRGFDANQIKYAPKSLFTVFRVPLIEIVCALMIEIMRRKALRSDSETRFFYYRLWSILLYTVALKSLFQLFEFVSTSVFSSHYYAEIIFFATIAIVVSGIISAFIIFIKGRKFFTNLRGENWQLSVWEKFGLASLFLVYVSLAFAPMLIYR